MCHGCNQTQDMTESHFCMILSCAHMVQENTLGHGYVNSIKAHWKYVLVAISVKRNLYNLLNNTESVYLGGFHPMCCAKTNVTAMKHKKKLDFFLNNLVKTNFKIA